MCCLRDQLQEVADAGHPDTAMVAMTVGAVRELLAVYPPVVVKPCVVIGLDLSTGQDMAAATLRGAA